METTTIKKIGNSAGIILDKSILTKIYDLKIGDDVEINYYLDMIAIKPKPGGAPHEQIT